MILIFLSPYNLETGTKVFTQLKNTVFSICFNIIWGWMKGNGEKE